MLKTVLENQNLSVTIMNKRYTVMELLYMNVLELRKLGPLFANLNAKKALDPFADNSYVSDEEKFIEIAKSIYETKLEIEKERREQKNNAEKIAKLEKLLEEKQISEASVKDIEKQLKKLKKEM